MFLYHTDECLEQPYSNFVCAVIILSVAWEITFYFKIFYEGNCIDNVTGFVCNVNLLAVNLNFCIFHCRERIYYMAETCDTGCKCTAYICIDKSKLCCFVVVLIVHVMNSVKCIYVCTSKPLEHCKIFLLNFFVVRSIDNICSDWLVVWSNLHTFLDHFVFTAVESVKKSFCKVGACAEELHFLSCLSCRNTAAD